MKTSLIFVVGFAVLAVAVSRVPPPEEENEAEEAKRIQLPFEDVVISAAEWALKNDPDYRDAVNAKSQPTEKPKTQNGKRKLIPSPNSLALKSNPITLGFKIAELDEEEQEKYIDEMEELMNEYKGTIIEDFYEAAIDAIDHPIDALWDWNEVIEDAKEYGEEMANNFPGIENLFKPNTSLKIIDDILKADPLKKANQSGIPIELHIGTGSSGSLVVASSFINVYSISGKVKGTIQRLIMDRIAEKGGVEKFHRKYFNAPSSNPHKAGVR